MAGLVVFSPRLDELVRERARTQVVLVGLSLLEQVRAAGFTRAEAARLVADLFEHAAPAIDDVHVQLVAS